jgi:hypothetical protein
MTVRQIPRNALIAVAAAIAATSSRALSAQAWNYPSYQPPTIVDREFNGGVSASGGTVFLFQWREAVTQSAMMSVDLGLADPKGVGATKALIGGNYMMPLARARADQPLDLLFTAGAGVAIGDGSLFRVPIGVSVGHRFPLEGGLAITPYVHPRLSLDFCDRCARRDEVSLNFDIGANFELTPQLALRASAMFTGSNATAEQNAFGLSLAFRPAGVVRR